MRTKDEILDSAGWNFIMSAKPRDVSRVQSLHTLEVLIDIRDELDDLKTVQRGLYDYQVMG